MRKEKLSFDELMNLFKKDREEYRKYLDGCSWNELVNYANEGLNSCNKDIVDSKSFLEKTVNAIDLSKLYRK